MHTLSTRLKQLEMRAEYLRRQPVTIWMVDNQVDVIRHPKLGPEHHEFRNPARALEFVERLARESEYVVGTVMVSNAWELFFDWKSGEFDGKNPVNLSLADWDQKHTLWETMILMGMYRSGILTMTKDRKLMVNNEVEL